MCNHIHNTVMSVALSRLVVAVIVLLYIQGCPSWSIIVVISHDVMEDLLYACHSLGGSPGPGDYWSMSML